MKECTYCHKEIKGDGICVFGGTGYAHNACYGKVRRQAEGWLYKFIIGSVPTIMLIWGLWSCLPTISEPTTIACAVVLIISVLSYLAYMFKEIDKGH